MGYFVFMTFLICLLPVGAFGAGPGISEDTRTCIECHSSINPGIVADWKQSRHARVSPSEGLKKTALQKRISASTVPEKLVNNVIGCAECHTLHPGTHKDTFEHNEYQVHVVVTPQDCASCHPTEVKKYEKNLMAHAYGNLQKNMLYRSLADSVNDIQYFKDMTITYKARDELTDADSCLVCHGTIVQVEGARKRPTSEGEMVFPVLSGWPNQGVGRINPDHSKGCCTACHTRHQFSIEVARKPYTCAGCHKGPDVPAYKVYMVSKHGNVFSSKERGWNFDAVPWTVGKDFTAPTCAVCHLSLLVSDEGDTIVERSHQMSDRNPWRIFGIYAHAHPRSPDTTIIKNRSGLQLPSELTGEPALDYLIDKKEHKQRRKAMQGICLSCHSTGWTDGHFSRLENTLKTTNEMILTVTKMLLSAWEKGAAKGPAQQDSIFNETIEKKWVEQWLFYANSVRFASAMAGADYGVFAKGRWNMSKNAREMIDILESKLKDKR